MQFPHSQRVMKTSIPGCVEPGLRWTVRDAELFPWHENHAAECIG
jgi:hypothetical protein